jgi:hypothetical protein
MNGEVGIIAFMAGTVLLYHNYVQVASPTNAKHKMIIIINPLHSLTSLSLPPDAETPVFNSFHRRYRENYTKKDHSRADESHDRQITSPHAMLLLEIKLPLLILETRL